MSDDFEGSANTEGFEEMDDESTLEENSENIKNSEDESKSEETVETKVETDSTEQDKSVKFTEKGTKLDPNPQSAIHQELANAKREAEQYREFMSNPKQVKKYLADLEAELGEQTGESKAEIKDRAEDENLITDPSKIETPEDFKSYVQFLTKDLQNAKQDLLKERDSMRIQSNEKAIGERLVSEIDSVQSKYPFLKAFNADGTPNPDFDEVLDKEIADQFEELDKDPNTGKYFGKVSLTAIADRAVRIRKLGEATGSKNAQTTVLDKRQGAVRTSGGGTAASDESKMSATQLIASRMQRASR
jgi:hypothetical protein